MPTKIGKSSVEKQAFEMLAKANQSFEETGKLTPETKKQFEESIKAADKQTESHRSTIKEYQAKLAAWMETNGPRVEELSGNIDKIMVKLSPEDSKKVAAILAEMQQDTLAFQPGRDEASHREAFKVFQEKQLIKVEQLERVAPGLLKTIEELNLLKAPYEEAVMEVARFEELAVVPVYTRLAYGIALSGCGEFEQAKAQFREAILDHGASPDSITQYANEVAGEDSVKAEAIYKAAILAADSVEPLELFDKVRPSVEAIVRERIEVNEKLENALSRYGQGTKEERYRRAVESGDKDVAQLAMTMESLTAKEESFYHQMKAPVVTRYMLGLHFNKLGENGEASFQFKEAIKIIEGRQIKLTDEAMLPVLYELRAADKLAGQGKVITPGKTLAQANIDMADQLKERTANGLVSLVSPVELPVDIPLPDYLVPEAAQSHHLAVEHLVRALDADEAYTKQTVGKLKQGAINVASDVTQDIGVSVASLALARQLLVRMKGKGLASTVVAYGGAYLMGGLAREGTDSISAWTLGTPEHSLEQNMMRQSIATTAVLAGNKAYNMQKNSIARQLGADDLQALAARSGVKLTPGASGIAGYKELVAGMEAHMVRNAQLYRAGRATEASITAGSRMSYLYRLLNPGGKINLGPTATLRGLRAHVGAQNFYGNMMTGAAFGSVYSGGHAYYDFQRGAINPATGKPYTSKEALDRTLDGTKTAAWTAALLPPFLGVMRTFPGIRQIGDFVGAGVRRVTQGLGTGGVQGALAVEMKELVVPALVGTSAHALDGIRASTEAAKWNELLSEAQGVKAERDARKK